MMRHLRKTSTPYPGREQLLKAAGDPWRAWVHSVSEYMLKGGGLTYVQLSHGLEAQCRPWDFEDPCRGWTGFNQEVA